MNIFLELAKQGYEFHILPQPLQRIKVSIVGKNDNGKLCWVSGVITNEMINENEYVKLFINDLIKNLKKTR